MKIKSLDKIFVTYTDYELLNYTFQTDYRRKCKK